MKYFLRLTVFLTSFFLFWGVALGYVSPGKPTGYVNDYTGMLSGDTRADLEVLLKQFHDEKKGQVVVVIIPTLGDDDIEGYSIALAREWEIGEKGKDNGVLLLVAKNDHKLRIEVGYGFEGVLTDIKSSRIIREIITPQFKSGNYNEGISQGVTEILGVLDPSFRGAASSIHYAATDTQSSSGEISFLRWIEQIGLFGSFALVWLASILGRSKSWWFGGLLGGLLGIVVGFIYGFYYIGILALAALTIFGFLFDYIVSRAYQGSVSSGERIPWWGGGGTGGGFGGSSSSAGFSGGGSFGGGGSSGRW